MTKLRKINIKLSAGTRKKDTLMSIIEYYTYQDLNECVGGNLLVHSPKVKKGDNMSYAFTYRNVNVLNKEFYLRILTLRKIFSFNIKIEEIYNGPKGGLCKMRMIHTLKGKEESERSLPPPQIRM